MNHTTNVTEYSANPWNETVVAIPKEITGKNERDYCQPVSTPRANVGQLFQASALLWRYTSATAILSVSFRLDFSFAVVLNGSS